MFIIVFSFCELFDAHTQCFSSGPLVFAGPIFMNHREQALARLRSHPAQLKHKRDKHKGIWSSLPLRWDALPTSSTHLNFISGKMHKTDSFCFASVVCSLRRKDMLKCYCLVALVFLSFLVLWTVARSMVYSIFSTCFLFHRL